MSTRSSRKALSDTRPARFAVLFAAVLALAHGTSNLPLVPAAQANVLTKILREAGEAGGKGVKLGLGALDAAVRHVKALPPAAGEAPLAAHATPEGHWKFANRDGEVFTAATPAELARVAEMLAPGMPADTRLALYLTEDTVFRRREFLKDLPDAADLHIVSGRDSFPLVRHSTGGGTTLSARVRPSLAVELGEQAMFDESLYLLRRPLNASSIRVLTLEPGGPKRLSSVPRFDPATKATLVDAIDPGALPAALAKLKGQTVLLTGRVSGNRLAYQAARGGEQTLALQDVLRAAEQADVNVAVLNASVPLQPGDRNWLWQTVAVAGLDDALRRPSYADFLEALAGGRGELAVSAVSDGMGRVLVHALPSGGSGLPLPDSVTEWATEIAGNLGGRVVVLAVDLHARDKDRQEELDLRLVPWLPAAAQFAYLAGLVAGVLSFALVRAWWSRLWPAEERGEYASAAGYQAARAARLAAFLLIFLAVAGPVALTWSLVQQIWIVLTLPFRALKWLAGRLVPRSR